MTGVLDGAYACGVFDRLGAEGLSRRFVERVLDLGVGAADRMCAQPMLQPEELALLRLIDAAPQILVLFDDKLAQVRQRGEQR